MSIKLCFLSIVDLLDGDLVVVLFVLIRVLAPVDRSELEDSETTNTTRTADARTAAGVGSGLDVLHTRVRGRGLGGQREESDRARLHLGDWLIGLLGRHDVYRVVYCEREL